MDFGWPKNLLRCVDMEDLLLKWPEDVIPMGVSNVSSAADMLESHTFLISSPSLY